MRSEILLTWLQNNNYFTTSGWPHTPHHTFCRMFASCLNWDISQFSLFILTNKHLCYSVLVILFSRYRQIDIDAVNWQIVIQREAAELLWLSSAAIFVEMERKREIKTEANVITQVSGRNPQCRAKMEMSYACMCVCVVCSATV